MKSVKNHIPNFVFLIIISLFIQCSSKDNSVITADYIFTNAKVYTVNKKQVWAESVAIKGNEIIFVGNTADVNSYINDKTKVIDLEGKMLLPGFIDTHAHPVMAAAYTGSLILDQYASVDNWVNETKKFINQNPEKLYYIGLGFMASTFGPEGPTKELLDAISTDKPIILIDEGWHSAWVNSKAFELAGITKNTPDPIPNIHFYKRNQNGELTGWCVENNSFAPILKKLNIVTTDKIVKKSEELFNIFSSAGITTFYDAGMTGFEDKGYAALQKLENKGDLPFRIVGSYGIQSKSQLKDAVKNLTELKEKYTSDLVHPQVMKIHNDGTIEAYSANLFEDYTGQKNQKGAILLEGDELKNFVIEVDAAGYDIHIHGIGDRAINEALNAFEAAKKVSPNSKNRYTIAHNQLIIDADLPRFGELGVIAQSTPYWFSYIYDEGQKPVVLDEPVGDRANNYNRFRTIHKNGGLLTFGSDFPATGSIEGMYPLANIEIGHTRKPLGLSKVATTPPIDEALSLETMIEGYTINAAYQIKLEKEIGSIEVGKKADIVILSENIFDQEPHQIHTNKVFMTMMNGKITYDSNEK